MSRRHLTPFGSSTGRFFLVILPVVAAVCFSSAAFAQNVAAGCSQAVWTALNAKAQAQVAYDVAVTRQMINKPDSVLSLTCFSQAAGVSAANGGVIYSGNFTTQLATIMPVEGNTYNCAEIGNLWNTIATSGVSTAAPYATFDALMNGTAPSGAGSDFTAGWTAAQSGGVFQNLKTAVNALPTPTPMDFSTAKSSCDVLQKAQIITGSCPSAPASQAGQSP
jgi:hypothetical protein